MCYRLPLRFEVCGSCVKIYLTIGSHIRASKPETELAPWHRAGNPIFQPRRGLGEFVSCRRKERWQVGLEKLYRSLQRFLGCADIEVSEAPRFYDRCSQLAAFFSVGVKLIVCFMRNDARRLAQGCLRNVGHASRIRIGVARAAIALATSVFTTSDDG